MCCPDRRRCNALCMPELLIDKYLALKDKYRNYDTKHALKLMQAFRYAVRHLAEKGYTVAFEMLGSINFGIVDPHSDADCILYHYCEIHESQGECPPNCSNLSWVKKEAVESVRRSFQNPRFSLEILDTINLRYLEDSLKRADFSDENEAIFRFFFYRSIGRPVNRPLVRLYFNQLLAHTEIVQKYKERASLMLAEYLHTTSHRYSFNKYNERILNRGLVVPEELTSELSGYLKA